MRLQLLHEDITDYGSILKSEWKDVGRYDSGWQGLWNRLLIRYFKRKDWKRMRAAVESGRAEITWLPKPEPTKIRSSLLQALGQNDWEHVDEMLDAIFPAKSSKPDRG